MKHLFLFFFVAILAACSSEPKSDEGAVPQDATSQNTDPHDHSHEGHSHDHSHGAAGNDAADWKTYENDEYKIDHPSSWETSTASPTGASFFAMTAQETTDDEFRENVNLFIQDVSNEEGGLTLDEFVEISESQIESLMTNAVISFNKRMDLGGDIPFHRMIYRSDQGKFAMKFIQHCYVYNQKAYILTFTTEEDQHDKYVEAGERILDSFRLK